MTIDFDSETLVCAAPAEHVTTLIVREDSRVVVVIRCAICGQSARAHWSDRVAECGACGERERIAVASEAAPLSLPPP